MNETLRDWHKYGWLIDHQSSRQEISDLLAIADRDLRNAQIAELSSDWRMSIAYNAALQAANAALAAAGYRAERNAHHYRLIQSLAYTINLDQIAIDQLEAFRKKRNVSNYTRPDTISQREAETMVALAVRIRDAVVAWLPAHHADLWAG